MSTLSSGRRVVAFVLIALLVTVLLSGVVPIRATGEDLSISMTDSPDPVAAGSDITYTITVTNNSGTTATGVRWDDIIPLNTTFRSVSGTTGWSCTTPGVGGIGTVTCLNGTVPANDSVVFTLVVRVNASTPGNTVIENSALVVYPTDPDEGNNNTGVIETLVKQTADVSIQMTATPNPVVAGNELTYNITVRNGGPEGANAVTMTTAVPTNTTFVSLTRPSGWVCTTPIVGDTGPISCLFATLGVSVSANFQLKVLVPGSLAGGETILNTGNVTTTSFDPNSANDSTGNVETTVRSTADLSITLAASPFPKVNGGENLNFTVTLNNSASYEVGTDVSWSIETPPSSTYRSVTAPSGWTCTTPAIGSTGTVTCSRSRVAVGSSHVFVMQVRINSDAIGGTQVGVSTAIVTTSFDPDDGNNNATVDVVVTPPTLVSTPALPFNVTYRNLINRRYTRTISVSNTGEAGSVLNLRVISNSSPYTVTGLPLSVKQGDPAKTFTLSCNPPSGGLQTGTLVLGTNEVSSPTYTFNLACGTVRQGIGVFRPSNGLFYMRIDLATGTSNVISGTALPGDLPVVGDWNGDGIETIGFWRPSTRTFYLRDSNSPAITTWNYIFVYGNTSNAIPLVGDWDGDGRDSVGVYNLGTNQFLLRNSLTAGVADLNQRFGGLTDRGIAGDWNGDGIDTIGVYKFGTSLTFFFTNQTCSNCAPPSQGRANFTPTILGDLPIVGDWDGDGRTTFGLFRTSSGTFFLSNEVRTGIPANVGIPFGQGTDLPIVGRWVFQMQTPVPPPAPSFIPR